MRERERTKHRHIGNTHERGTLRVALVFLSWRWGGTVCASTLIMHDSTNHKSKDAKSQFKDSMCANDRKQVCGSVQACVWVRLRHFLVWNATLPPHPSLSLLSSLYLFLFWLGFSTSCFTFPLATEILWYLMLQKNVFV